LTEPTNRDGNAPAPGRRPFGPRSRAFQLAALGLIVASGLCGTGLAFLLRPPDVSEREEPKPSGPLAPYFEGWGKPDLVLVVTGDQHGYLEPCGCSEPQKGGLERRYNLIQMLKARGWPVVAVDLGNVPQVEAPAGLPNVQGLIKYRYAMRAMNEMGYFAVGLGDHEAAMPLTAALDEYALENPKPRVVSADLMERDQYPDETAAWRQADPVPGVDLKVGVTAVLGPSVYEQIKAKNAKVKFADSGPALAAALKEMASAKIDLPVVLYMGSLVQGAGGAPSEAMACAAAFPQVRLIVAHDEGDLARAQPVWSKDPKTGAKTMLVSLGHKGKAVGVVGVFRKPGQPLELRYQMIEMGPDFKTPPDGEKANRALALMEEYTKELRDKNYLAKYPPASGPTQAGRDPMPKYIGTDRCTDCHKSAGEVWKHTPHSHAYKTLVTRRDPPSNEQYNPECVVCHTVGFGYKTGFRSEKETAKLLNVGCESCHGPGSLHANDPNNLALRAEMNPWKAKPDETAKDKADRIRRLDDMCQKCHDPENDVHWSEGSEKETGFERHWPKIAHPTPPEEKQDADEATKK
jgi:cytochrome c554/c'-like protein